MVSEKIVVTGAAGFLGSHVVRRLRESGAHGLAVVREAASPTSERDPVSMRQLLSEPHRLDGSDALIHSAAIRHRYGAHPRDYRAANVDLVEALMRASAGRVRRFVFVSSVGVYGFPKDLPVDEKTKFVPRTLYSQTKIDAEKLVRTLAPQLGLSYTIVRPTIIYGAGDNNGMLDKLARMIQTRRYLVVGSGDNLLHHTYIDDVVEGTLFLARSDAANNEDFILAGPETITLRRLSELVARKLGKKIPPVHVPLGFARSVATLIDVAAYRGVAFTEREPPINHEKLDVMTVPIAFDSSKVRRAGFSPSVNYETGIEKTLVLANSKEVRTS